MPRLRCSQAPLDGPTGLHAAQHELSHADPAAGVPPTAASGLTQHLRSLGAVPCGAWSGMGDLRPEESEDGAHEAV